MKTKRYLSSLALGLGLTLAVLAGLGGNLPLARADTYTVTNTDASGPGSLRQAILDANGNAGHDTIDFGITGTIVLTDGLPAISDDLTISGPGAEQLAVSGANAYRVFTINSGASVTITGVTVQDGRAADSNGGGIWSAGMLHLDSVQVVGNSAADGGGVFVDDGSATLNETQVISNSAAYGGGVFVAQGSATLSGTQITANDATTGSALYTGGTITPTTALTITGDIYQAGGRFAGSSHDLRVEGSLSLAGGDFYGPNAPNSFVLSGPFVHTGGIYHQTRDVTGSGDVGFPKAGGVILNANGRDLDSTEVALTAGADCAGVPVGEAVHHCTVITPTRASGRDAVITFFYLTSEGLPGHACAAMEAYRWTGAWGTPLTRDASYGSAGRLCGPDPQSLRVTGVKTFSPFVLRGPAADVRISKAVTPGEAVSGQPITYTLTLANAGLITATGVVITDTIPVSVTNTGVISSGVTITRRVGTRYVWDVADLAPGAGGGITITGVLSDSLVSGVLPNTATITTTALDSDVTNNSSSASVTVLPTWRYIYLPLVLRDSL